MKTPELLSPAGDFEKLKDALYFGADAVYLGTKEFSLRTQDEVFNSDTIKDAVSYVKSKNKKIYIAINIIPTQKHLDGIKNFLLSLYNNSTIPDAFIVSDPGVFSIVKNIFKNQTQYHLSTQANCINSESAKFWYNSGIKRIILGRELNFEEILSVRENIPKDIELEVFIHGAMCMSYSGRCLISSFLTGRNPNRGDCAHPCRWKYFLMEETRKGDYFPIIDDGKGTFIMNSHDLCLGHDIVKLLNGFNGKPIVDSFKIEGRNKGTYYAGVVTAVYRKLIDSYYNGNFDSNVETQLDTVSHRPYSKGFYYNTPRQNQSDSQYIWKYRFLGKCSYKDNCISVSVRNQFSVGDTIEIFKKNAEVDTYKVSEIFDFKSGEAMQTAKNQQKVNILVDSNITPFEYGFLRKIMK